MRAHPTRIELFKTRGTRYRSRIYRRDGAVVALEGGSWNKIGGQPGRVPHDIAHLIVERELGLRRGLWGILAAGGLVKNAELLPGHGVPHAARRAKAITAEARDELMRAEVMVRALADASISGNRDFSALRRELGERWWVPVDEAAFEAIDGALRAAAREWDALPADGTMTLRWSGD